MTDTFRRPSRREIDAVEDRMRNLSLGGRVGLMFTIGVEKSMGANVDSTSGEQISDFELYRRLMKHYGVEPDHQSGSSP